MTETDLHPHGFLVLYDDFVNMSVGQHSQFVPDMFLCEGSEGPSPGALPESDLGPGEALVLKLSVDVTNFVAEFLSCLQQDVNHWILSSPDFSTL